MVAFTQIGFDEFVVIRLKRDKAYHSRVNSFLEK